MSLTAPGHLRGRISNHNRALLDERAAWIRQAHGEGYSATAIGRALGVSDGAAFKAFAKAGCVRIRKQSLSSLQGQGIVLGKPSAAYDSLPIPARKQLADEAAKHGKPMLRVMADFWAQHHGAQG